MVGQREDHVVTPFVPELEPHTPHRADLLVGSVRVPNELCLPGYIIEPVRDVDHGYVSHLPPIVVPDLALEI